MGSTLFVDTVFGLAAHAEETNETESGFRPADLDSEDADALFGDIRLEGFAAMLRSGFARHLIMVGGGIYAGKTMSEGEIWYRMLTDDFDIQPSRVSYLESKPNTRGNVEAVATHVRRSFAGGYPLPSRVALVSNFYHLLRASADFFSVGLSLPVYPAESFWLIGHGYGDAQMDELATRLGGGPLARRVALEARGIAQKIDGTFQPLTH